METCHGRVLFLATGILMSAFLPAEGAPLPSYRTGGSEEPAAVSLHLPLALSLTALAALVVVLANCMTCCKERPINFKEFEDNFDDEIDFTPPAEDTPSMQSPAEVYTLAVPPVALPGPPHLQPPSRIAEGSAGVQVARHALSYIQEIGNGWFGKVLLSEMYSDPAAARVVVKELKANASAKEQNDFLQHGDPYRVLQHPNLLQCLGQCVEAIPFLLVFEYCEMGDLRSYLSQQDWMFRNAELLQLQKMACEIAAGVTHLHKNNFLHSDLALRNCFLTADLTVKVGDYGIGPYRYKEDYIITEDDESAPLRWLAPELVGERHGGVVTMEQTKPGNVWALGVTLWELLENAGQPYPHLSDREVLNHVIRELQVKPFKPQLELPYSERWYEVLQFCWLSPDKRATAEEVHRLLTYLRMQGQKDMEEDFEQRWSALKPNPVNRQAAVSDSSFPILEQFAEDSLRPEVDEVLTVTETSRGLSFEYVWEAAKHDHYDGSHGRSAMDTTLNYHSMFFPVPSDEIQAHFPDPAAARPGSTETRGTASRVPDVLPVLDAHKPSNGNEYYIQLEEQGESACEGNGPRGSDGDTLSDRPEFVVLQDVHLDESSTDADFFHQSIDSKDSLLQDSHIWSSSEHESPYHTNIFSEGDSKQENPQSWEKSFMELPVRNGNPFLQVGPLEAPEAATDKRLGDSFLGDCLEATQRGELSGSEGSADMLRLLNTEKLADNFLFLKENSLIKESSGSSSGNRSPQQDLLSPGLPHTPEDSFKMSSWDNLDNLDGAGIAEAPLKPAEPITFPKDRLSDLTIDFLQPVIQKEILVPSISLVTEPTFDIKMPVGNGSSSEDLDLLNSADTGIDSAFDSSSGGIDVLTSIADSFPSLTLLGSATADPLCIDAKPPCFEDLLGSPKDSFQPIGSKQLADEQVHLSPTNNSHSEGLTCDDLSELIDNDQEETEAVLSDHDELTVEEEEEEGDDALLVKPTLSVSGPSMDQISQDSLLDDSVSTTPPTAENSAETPDSLDSLDIHRLEAHTEDPSAPAAPQKLQPPYKTADSGYETENLESPEWISQPIVKEHSLEENGTSLAEEVEEAVPEELVVTTTLVPPEIIVSEVESVEEEEEVQEEEETSEEQAPEPLVPGDEPFIGGNYRDSAYFSDNESEPERKSEETNGASVAEGPGLSGSAASVISDASGAPQSAAGEELDPSLVFQQKHLKSNGTGPSDEVETSEALPPAGNGFPESVLSGEEDWDKEELASTQDGHQDSAPLHLFPDLSSSTEPPASQPSLPLPTSAKPLPENMVHAKLTRTYASDSPKVKEPDMEGRFLSRQDCSGADAPEDGMEADEEDENSDDSDDDARAYRLHSSSSESEEEDDDTVHPVPVIISDDSGSRNLRSLLKARALHGQPELPLATPALSPADSSKRAVSFFDDVTVYLFDQETPTKELGDHSSASNSQVAEFSSPVPTASYLNRFTNSESSTDEEGGGFEWDDDFSSSDGSFMTKGANDSMASKSLSTPAASNYFSPPLSTSRASDTSWNSASSNYSRFSISPASIANFSLTHLTDSDIEQGGDSEDGEKD